MCLFIHFYRYQLIESTDGLLGAPTGNGSWNGLVAMLLHDVSNNFLAFVCVREREKHHE